MTPEKIIELAVSVGLTLPRRGEYFFINHEDLGRLLMAEREAVVDIAQSWCGRLVHEEEFQKEIRARGEA